MENQDYWKIQKFLFIFSLIFITGFSLLLFLFPPSLWYHLIVPIIAIVVFPISMLFTAIIYPKVVIIKNGNMNVKSHFGKSISMNLSTSHIDEVKGRRVIIYKDDEGKIRDINPNVFDEKIKAEIRNWIDY